MANLDISIDPATITDVRSLLSALETRLEVDFVPSFLKRLGVAIPTRNVAFRRNLDLQRYELDFDVETRLDEGGDKELVFHMSALVLPDKAGAGRPADYMGKLVIPLAGGSAELAFEGRVNRGVEDMFVGQCTFNHDSVSLAALVGAVAPALGEQIPEEIAVPVGANLVAVLAERGSGGRRLIVGVGLHAGVDLAKVPVVGEMFVEGLSRASFSLELLAATHAFTHAELQALNTVTEQLSAPFAIRPSSAEQQGLEKGAHLVGYAALGSDLKRTWYAPLNRSKPGSRALRKAGRSFARSSGSDSLVTVSDNGAWIAVERSVGPVHVAKIGITYRKGAVELIPEMVLTVGDLRMLLDGIVIRLPIGSSEAVSFRLDGFGLEYENDALHMGGSFLRTQQGEHTDYSGQAALRLSVKGISMGLAAIGAYAHVDGRPSLFLYASLDYPLGGPPFFFVTGLSAGFGYGRDLISPQLEDIKTFPLVRQALDGVASPVTNDPGPIVTSQLRALAQYIKIAPDTGFLALGVKFTSFKLIEGFALMTAVLGKRFEVGLLGLARLQVPFAGSNPLVVMEMAMQARFAPSEGLLLLRAQLTPESYILSKACRLTGGFAFATWFAGNHAGDFVLTMGGYHPSFKRPAHYPVVPRLGFDWRVGSTLNVRGEGYFALCSHAVMAGSSLTASFRSGKAHASFHLGSDFLICWKPYCYDINLRVHFKAGYGCLSASLGADLHIWGPEFGGTAKIKVFLFSFTIKFGDQGSQLPRAIPWSEFCPSFLPADGEVCSVAVAKGLTRQVKARVGDEDVWVVNPKDLVLTTDSVIPTKMARHPASGTPLLMSGDFGIVPMGVKESDLLSEHVVTMTYEGAGVAADKFKITAMTRPAPTGLWGKPDVVMSGSEKRLRFPKVNGTSFVKGALSGLRIEPATPPKGGKTADLSVKVLGFEMEAVAEGYAFLALPAFPADGADDTARRATIATTIGTHAARDALLTALGFDPTADVALTAAVADTFVFAPQVKDTRAAA